MKLLILEVAALGYHFWEKHHKADFWNHLRTSQMDSIFPAVTSTIQASFRTASPPSSHGMISNGLYNRELRKTFFWEQSSSLYSGSRIWDDFRKNGHNVGQICWQQSLGNDSDIILSPAPIHKHHGGMIQDFYSSPNNLYKDIVKANGSSFKLQSYWGPLASKKSTKWIADALIYMLKTKQTADLQLAYLPHLDYALQKFGPNSPQAEKEFTILETIIEEIIKTANSMGYETIIFGDYAIEEAKSVIYPNIILKEHGFFKTRKVNSMQYPDIYSSDAFAMVDHQIAHIYINNKDKIAKIADIYSEYNLTVLTKEDPEYIDHKNSGEIILKADKNYWFAYPWWNDNKEKPDYATHIDIHNKPGFDPCELFFEVWPPMSISTNTSKVKGTHGRADSKTLLASTLPISKKINIIELANSLKNQLLV